MREPFVFTFNLKLFVQEPVYFFPSLSCLFLYWFPARTENELTIWMTHSTFSLQSLHKGDTSWRSMPFAIAFVLRACSWAAPIRLSVSLSDHMLSATATSFDLAFSLFLSGIDHAMLSHFILPIFHSLFLLYSSHQSLFLVVTLQLQSLEVSRCCLQHNQKN